MKEPNVLLFDIDNTLLDFSAGAMQAMEEIFREAGNRQPTIKACLAAVLGI